MCSTQKEGYIPLFLRQMQIRRPDEAQFGQTGEGWVRFHLEESIVVLYLFLSLCAGC